MLPHTYTHTRTGYQTQCIAKAGVAIGGQASVATNGLTSARRSSDGKARSDSEIDTRGDDYYDNVAIGSQAKVIQEGRVMFASVLDLGLVSLPPPVFGFCTKGLPITGHFIWFSRPWLSSRINSRRCHCNWLSSQGQGVLSQVLLLRLSALTHTAFSLWSLHLQQL